MKRTWIYLLTVITVITFSQSVSGAATPIKIALVAPMTGNAAQWGESLKEGVDLAVEELNNSGGVLGRPLEVVISDHRGNPNEAVAVAQKLITDKDIVATVGHFFTSTTLAAAPVFQRAGVPMVAVAATDPRVPKAGDYIFRVNVTNTLQGSGVIEWLVRNQKAKRLAILFVNDDYGRGITEVAKDPATKLGAQVVYEASIQPGGEQDFTVLLTSARAAKPDALVLFAFYSAGAQIITQAKRLGLNMTIAGSDGLYSPDLINLASAASEGVYVATWFHPDSDDPQTRQFVEKYTKRWKHTPDTWAPYAYDAVRVLAEAIKRAGNTDKVAIRDQLAVTKDFKGATGVITFKERAPDPAAKKLLFVVVQGGNFKLLK
jgi:branched-chain amino acid transport system substrate-binding protein